MNNDDPNLTSQESSPKSWRSFKKLKINRKAIHKRAKKAGRDTTRHANKFLIKRFENLKLAQRAVVTWLLIVAVILAAVGAQYVWSDSEYKIEAPAVGGTYAEGVIGAIETLNPLAASTTAETAASNLLFSSLYRHDSYGALNPDVAARMTIDETAKKYTVVLRDDVKWHDGKQLTADDVKFTIDMINNPSARVRSSLRTNWLDIKTRVLDKNTIEFTLPSRYAAFHEALTFPIVPKHILSGVTPGAVNESAFSQSPIGSGAFKYKLLQVVNKKEMRKTVYLTANEEYYRGEPKVARFELQTYQNNDALLKALRTNEVAAASDVDLSGGSIDEKRFTVQSHPVGNAVYLLINTTHPVLKDVKVRQALQAGIDTAKVRKMVGNQVTDLHLPFLNSQISGEKVPAAPQYNIATAKDLLTQAGWAEAGKVRKDKEGKELKLTIRLAKSSQFDRVAAELAAQLKALGIAAEIDSLDTSQPGVSFVQNVLQARNYDLLLYELPIGADPDVYPYWHSSQMGVAGYNFTNYSNNISDAALVSARDTVRSNLRNEKYIAFAKQWLSDAPAIGLYQQSMSYVYAKNVGGVADHAQFIVPADRYSNVQEWTVARQQVYKTP